MSTEKNEKTEDFLALENRIVKRLKTVFDPEIPVNVYDLGLIYKIDISDDQIVTIDMTLTAAGCPMADFILEDVKMKIESIEGVKAVTINLVTAFFIYVLNYSRDNIPVSPLSNFGLSLLQIYSSNNGLYLVSSIAIE